ncbi:MAG: DUF3500 domain-containing protein [Planctomycetaceae bacterium]|nr:DUF3500 domain-containing protein [Planctomycetaceae bacterium]
MLRSHILLLAAGGILLVPSTSLAQSDARPGGAMAQAASRFLESLDHSQKLAVSFGYDDPERLNWHFIPRERKGVGLWDLEGAAYDAACDLVKSGLTTAGYEKTLEVRSLEEVLYLFEGGEEEERRKKRHPHKYYVSLFGKPGPKGLWGWRFEGHHLSLNFSIQDGKIVSSTPEFFGANPGLIDAGPGRALRVLGKREDIARQILKACSKDTVGKVWLSKEAPKDIRGGGVAQPVLSEPEGLRYADMSMEQQKLVRDLIAEYLTAMPSTVVRERMAAIKADGMDDIHFAWWGGSELNEPHHYVLQGKSFIVEYNNTQNSANHVHAIWRKTSGDFNVNR